MNNQETKNELDIQTVKKEAEKISVVDSNTVNKVTVPPEQVK